MAWLIFFNISIYSTLFIAGYGWSLTLFSKPLRSGICGLIAAPILATSAITILLCWSVALTGTIVAGYWASIFMALISLFLIAWKRHEICYDIKAAYRTRKNLFLLGLLSLIPTLLMGMTAIRDGQISAPYRIGVDQIGYASAAQSFLLRESPKTLLETLKKDLQTSDDKTALSEVLHSLNYRKAASNIFVNIANRWGFSVLLAGATELANEQETYRLGFSLILFFHFLTSLALFLFLKRGLHFRVNPSLMLVLFYSCNVNIQNSLFEGMYGLVAAFPSLLLAITLYLRTRNRNFQLKAALTAAFLLTASLMIYMELGAVYIFCLGIGIILATRLEKQVLPVRWILAGVLGICLFYGPLLPGLLLGILDRAQTAGIAGWPQPHWASPIEILGILNIYTSTGIGTWERMPALDILNSFLTLLLLPATWFYFRLYQSELKWSLVLPAVGFTALIFIKSRFFSSHHNYQYMKVYTALLPIYLVGLGEIGMLFIRGMKSNMKWLPLALAPLLVYNFLLNNFTFLEQRGVIAPELFGKNNFLQSTYKDNYALYVPNEDNSSFYNTIVYFPRRISWGPEIQLRAFSETPVWIGFNKARLKDHRVVQLLENLPQKARKVDETSDMIIYDPALKVGSFTNPAGNFDEELFLKTLIGPVDEHH